MDRLFILLVIVISFAYKGNISNIFVEFALDQSDSLASMIKYLILKTYRQIVLIFLLSFCVTFIFGLFALDF